MFDQNNKRIAKNTGLLYLRMLLTMVVTLYTSRVVLKTLGVEDFGIYNVVGGVVSMFGFINAAMSAATQRYLTFEIGKKDFVQLKKVFNTSILIHAAISALIVLLAETIGLWFFYHKMIISEQSLDAALWVYQLSVLSAVVMIMSVPYNATIIAHEKMSAFAYISVVEVTLKLAVVYVLWIVNFDKLKLYALLIFGVQLLIRIIYGVYCNKHFLETKFQLVFERDLFKEMLSFAGWNLWGNCASVAFTQGVNLLLNMFFGPVVNAARAIAVQVQTAIAQFSSNFQMAINPQITKNYAQQNQVQMHNLIFKSSKFTFFLLLFFSLPVLIETNTLLMLWLGEVPDYTVVFLRLIICITIIDAVANPLMVAASATGRVKRYQSVVGSLLLTILPLSYLALKIGGNPSSVFIVHLIVAVIAFVVRLFIVKHLIHLSLSSYFYQVLLKCFIVTVCALPFPLLIHSLVFDSFLWFVLVVGATIGSVFLSVYAVGITNSERMFMKEKFALLLAKLRV